MPDITAFHHVALWTRRFDETVAFYRDGLGLTPAYEFRLDKGRAILLRCVPAIHELHDREHGPERGHIEVFERPDDGDGDGDDCPAEARLLHFALSTDDVDGMYQRALAAGATPRTEPRDVDRDNEVAAGSPTASQRFTPRIAFVIGPNGEVIEFFDDPLMRS